VQPVLGDTKESTVLHLGIEVDDVERSTAPKPTDRISR
jgi:hypothetical protein